MVLEAQIPIVAGPNRLTAYGFNRDNVKSADATVTVTGNDSLKQPGTLYILAIAVNKYANSQFDLRYAVADATDFAAELQRQEAKIKNYDRTEIISLQDAKATKANILEALTSLAARVKPEDAVVVYYAGHGTAQQNQFYLIPHDLGYTGARNQIDAAALQTILAHSISDRELERAFEGVDAGSFCWLSMPAIPARRSKPQEKRRGPMNSRGLAQLAYEKGMYVLTAAQSYQAAMEAAKLGHGYLTYALVEEGLKTAAADIQPADGQVFLKEWLDYATQRVPQMQEEKLKEAQGRQLEQVVAFVPGEEKTDPAKRKSAAAASVLSTRTGVEPFIVARPGTVFLPHPPFFFFLFFFCFFKKQTTFFFFLYFLVSVRFFVVLKFWSVRIIFHNAAARLRERVFTSAADAINRLRGRFLLRQNSGGARCAGRHLHLRPGHSGAAHHLKSFDFH